MRSRNDTDRAVGPWSKPVTVAEIPEAGARYELAADCETRAAIAQLAGLREIPALTASFEVLSRAAGVSVRGQVKARVGQTCVVSLEPIENEVNETVDLLFAPPAGALPEGEAPVRKKKGEPPEPLENGVIDLGAIATEFLMLGLDPYPRKQGVEFAPPEPESDPTAHPFAALAALKKQQ
jgi:uncharacterized metal-binding protein YceD (DUF177 family)